MEGMLPGSVEAGEALGVVFACFWTAYLTAAFGVGGGLALLGVMALVLPPVAVIPVHGAVQAGANASRLWLLRRHAMLPTVAWFTLGSLAGVAVGAPVASRADPDLVRAGVGAFILFSLWAPLPERLRPGPRWNAAAGAVSAFLTMFFGATGPFVAAAVRAAGFDRLRTSATHAAAMTTQHALKCAGFALAGFAFAPWAAFILACLAAGAAGSTVGARQLRATSDGLFDRVFRGFLSVLAAILIVAGLAAFVRRPA
ncbi:MAG: sulfite exporter TauE/SafE family protein [Pseudomonadota bacterium]